MTTKFPLWVRSTLSITLAAAISSCAYDSGYYTSVNTSYSSGYRHHGSGTINTSIFISTGNPRWGYDPYCHSYYDYTRRCYYDPYLLGYYPVGFRPPVIIGAPHPHGWRPGVKYCPPPRTIRQHQLTHYKNRDHAYRQLKHPWASKVRTQTSTSSPSRYWNSSPNASSSNRYPNSSREWKSERNTPSTQRYVPPSRNSYNRRDEINRNPYRHENRNPSTWRNSNHRDQTPTQPYLRPSMDNRNSVNPNMNGRPSDRNMNDRRDRQPTRITPTTTVPMTPTTTPNPMPRREMRPIENPTTMMPNDARSSRINR